MAPRTRTSVKALSLLVWSVCLVILGVHGGCGGGTSGTGVKALVTGIVLDAGAGDMIELIGEDGDTIASVQLGENGTWSADLPDGTAISAVRYGAVYNPLPTVIVVSAAVTSTLVTDPVTQQTTVIQVENTPTPVPTSTPSSGGGSDPTATPVPTDTPRTRPTATPTIDPTAFCAANPQRPACATPTPTPTNTRPPRATATPTIDPTAYCASNPNRPLCATPTPTP